MILELKGHEILVDEKYIPLLSDYSWYVDPATGYMRGKRGGKGNVKNVSFHRLVIGAKQGEFVDHINRNRLDNRRENLRIASRAQNAQNGSKITSRETTSRFRGVCWVRTKWLAQIKIEGKVKKRLGLFDNECEAAYAYDCASLKYHGEFGSRNFLPLVA